MANEANKQATLQFRGFTVSVATTISLIGLLFKITLCRVPQNMNFWQRKTDLRNMLRVEHLRACMRISINGPPVAKFPHHDAFRGEILHQGKEVKVQQ